MVVRLTPDGKALTAGDQVGIEKSMYLSLCRGHWEEQTGRWPEVKPKRRAKKPARKAAKNCKGPRGRQT